MFISNIAALLVAPSLIISAAVIADDPQDEARTEYSNCLVVKHNEAMKTASPVKQFEKMVETMCTEERTKFFDIIYESEKEFGSSNSEAKEYATEEADGVIQFIVDAYKNNFAGKASLVPS